MNNYFELFDIPQDFSINAQELERKYFKLQQEHHPDRFVNKNDMEKVASLQKATSINEGYEILKEPVKRAEYLLKLHGRKADNQDKRMLLENMERREALAESKTSEDLKILEKTAYDKRAECITDLEKAFKENDLEQAVKLTTCLKYLNRFIDEVSNNQKKFL